MVIVIPDRELGGVNFFNFIAKTGRRQKYHRGIIMFRFLRGIVLDTRVLGGGVSMMMLSPTRHSLRDVHT